jgi:hypothetical protein
LVGLLRNETLDAEASINTNAGNAMASVRDNLKAFLDESLNS